MTTITLPDELAERLNQIAHDEGVNLTDLLNRFANARALSKPSPSERRAAMQSMIGMIDADIPDFSSALIKPLDDFIGMIDVTDTDASTTVKETVRAHYRKKFTQGTTE